MDSEWYWIQRFGTRYNRYSTVQYSIPFYRMFTVQYCTEVRNSVTVATVHVPTVPEIATVLYSSTVRHDSHNESYCMPSSFLYSTVALPYCILFSSSEIFFLFRIIGTLWPLDVSRSIGSKVWSKHGRYLTPNAFLCVRRFKCWTWGIQYSTVERTRGKVRILSPCPICSSHYSLDKSQLL